MVHKKQFESFFKKVDKDVVFVYKGKSSLTFTKYTDHSNTDTRVKLISGLNHFMRYVYDFRVDDDIEYINEYITKMYFACINGANSISNSKTYDKDLNKLIIDICSMKDERFLSIIAGYVEHSTDEDLDESKATTDATLLNRDAKCLIAISVPIKFTYLFSSMIRCDMTYNETLLLFMEALTKNTIRALLKEMGLDYDEDAVDQSSTALDEFLFKLVGYHWSLKAKTHYKEKFNSVGIDQMLSTKKNKMDIYSALKKFMPVCIDKETAKEYSASDKAMAELYWTADKKYEHFRNKNKALTAYIQFVLKNVVCKQDLNKSFLQDINVADILVNSSDESSLRRDNSLYEDKEGHLLEIRQESAKNLFKSTLNALLEYEFDLREELPKYNVQNNHHFNQFILSKIFLSLTGEQRVYKEFYGPFSKVILALFYVRLLESSELEYFHPLINIMKCMGKPNNDIYKLGQIEDYLDLNEINVESRLFRLILGVYKHESGDNYILPLKEFTQLFEFLDAPYRVRHLLFPDRFPDTKPERSSIKKYASKSQLTYADALRKQLIEGVY